MNQLKALRRKLYKKQSKFTAQHEFKGADELTEACTAKPIDLAIDGNAETFSAFIEDLLAPDSRIIPTK